MVLPLNIVPIWGNFSPFLVGGGYGLWFAAGSFTDFCLFTCRLRLILPTTGPLLPLFKAYGHASGYHGSIFIFCLPVYSC